MTTQTNYQEQATDFLKATNTTFAASFKTHDYYFSGDKETRDIYNVTLKNGSHRYRFTFGQSISNQGTAPTAYDVLACIEKYPVYDFADFCANYGYDEDSRSAFKTYKAVKREWENVNKLFTEDQLELLREIQ